MKVEITAVVKGLENKPIISCKPFICTIWPLKKQTLPRQGEISIIDPEGETREWLKKNGVNLKTFNPASKPKVLVIGRRALHNARKLPFSAEDVYNGMRVFIFEQYCGDLERFGFRTEDCFPRNVFIGDSKHPLSFGLVNDNLRDWSGNSTLISQGPKGDTTHTPVSRRTIHWSNRGCVASNVIETPNKGPFKAIFDCEFDLAYTPLLSWRHGAGEIVFSQLDISGRTKRDPAVERIRQNIVDYLQKPIQPQNRTAVCLSQPTRKFIDSLGFSSSMWNDSPSVANNIVVLGRKDVENWSEFRDKVLDFTRSGGTTLIFPAVAKLMDDPVFKGLSLRPFYDNKATCEIDDDKLLNGVGLQHLHWRQPVSLLKIKAAKWSGFHSMLNGLAGTLPYGEGRFVFIQLAPQAFLDYTMPRRNDAKFRKHASDKPLSDSWYSKNMKRTRWQSNIFYSLILGNLKVQSSPELIKGLFASKRKLPFYPVNKWVLLGPFDPPSKPGNDPLKADFNTFIENRNFNKQVKLPSGRSISWYKPSDFNNGLGIGGKINLGKVYGVRTGLTTIAISYLWSSRDRLATIQFGADWWLKININGKEVFQTNSDIKSNSGRKFSTGFGFSIKTRLKKGWNEVVCVIGSGSAGNAFWFRVSNPGDMTERQTINPPTEAPTLHLRFTSGGKYGKLSTKKLQALENATTTFSLYTEPLNVNNDPYLFMRW